MTNQPMRLQDSAAATRTPHGRKWSNRAGVSWRTAKGMTVTRSFAFLTLGLCLASAASADRLPNRLDGRGTFTGTDVDTNGDGIGGSVVTGSASAPGLPLGLSINAFTEVVFVGFNTASCPGDFENRFIAYPIVLTNRNGDQLWSVLDQGHVCFTPTGAITEIEVRWDMVGGTGEFEGAEGTIEGLATGQTLAVEGNRLAFGAFSGKLTVNLAK